jgi:hypothetical protein
MANVALDDDLIEGLKQAKKSPRYFALIAKGVSPLKLLVQKKKFRDGELMKAKTEAKGNEIITGVLTASGTDFAFQVVGEEEPSLKPVKLKELIAEQAEMPSKPRWELVKALPELGDAEDEQGEQDSQEVSGANVQAPAADPQAVLAAWQAARSDVIARLREVGKEIAAANHAESAPALIELKAVIANLTEKPATKQQIAELERYLGDDDVVLDVCELAYDIRTRPLAALADLKQSSAA